MVFLELSVGQYTSTTTFKCWSMTKLFKGKVLLHLVENNI